MVLFFKSTIVKNRHLYLILGFYKITSICYIQSLIPRRLDTLRGSAHAKGDQKTGNILDKGSLGHEEEGSGKDGLDNLGRDALVKSSNTLVLDDLAESIHDRVVPLLGVV